MAFGQDERRRHPRSFRSFKGFEDKTDPGVVNHVDNISVSGVMCHTQKPVPVMTKMSVVLDLPDEAEVRLDCEGIVIRCDPDEKGDDHYKLAIVFTKLSDDDHERIRDHVEHDLTSQTT